MFVPAATKTIQQFRFQMMRSFTLCASSKQIFTGNFPFTINKNMPNKTNYSSLYHYNFFIVQYNQSKWYSSQADSVPNEDQMALAKLEYESCKLDGVLEIPSKLSDDQWEELALMPSTYQKRKYLRYLFLTEMKKLNDKKKNEVKRAFSEKRREEVFIEQQEFEDGNRHIVYGLWNNSYLMKFGDSRIKRNYNYKVMHAMLRGQQIVFDAGYKSMNSPEETRAAEQFSIGFRHNRVSKDPFYIHMCNFDYDSRINKKLTKSIPTVHDTDFPMNFHKESYLNHFPKEQLVYLTPHCNTELSEFDHDAVYIVGYLVDTRDSEPLSLAKAKKENLKMRKLPLDRYLNWGTGQKSLTLDQIMGILVEVKDSGSWVKAFDKHIPKRKLRRSDEMTVKELRDKMRKKKYERVNMKSLFEE